MSNKVENLTPEQEARTPEYVEKWTKIGLQTGEADFDKCRELIGETYTSQGLDAPKRVITIRGGSAVSIAVMSQLLMNYEEEGKDVTDPSIITDEAILAETAEIVAKFNDPDQKNPFDLSSRISEQIFGCQEAPWLAYYNFFEEVCDTQIKIADPIMEYSKYSGWWAPYDNIAIVGDFPLYIKFEDEKRQGEDFFRLNCENGAAIEYGDGFCVYVIGGTRVPKWIAEFDPETVDSKKILAIDNAEHRMIAIKKMGVERMLEHGKVIDIDEKEQGGPYKLVDMSSIIEGTDYAPFLQMKNPSEDKIHLEGVHPDCRTVADALEFREGAKRRSVLDFIA